MQQPFVVRGIGGIQLYGNRAPVGNVFALFADVFRPADIGDVEVFARVFG